MKAVSEFKFRSFGLLVVICGLHAAMLGWGVIQHSPTADEAAYLSAGVSHWHFGRFDLTKVSPPLIRLTASLPVVMASPKVDWTGYRVGPGVRDEHGVGHDFMAANGRHSLWLFTIARFSCIPYSILGACVCYLWALQLWGRRSALVALLLWCMSPNILAHGQLMTPDVGVTALTVASTYCAWRWSHHPSCWRGITTGVVLGLAILAKTNAVVLGILLPLVGIAAASRHVATTRRWRHAAIQSGMAAVACCYILNLGYGFDGTFERLDRYEFVSRGFRGAGSEETHVGNRFKGSVIGWLRIPLPKPFVEGIDLQRKDFENIDGRAKTYWRGQWYDSGWWWYYFYAIAVKAPLGILVMIGVSVVVEFCRHGRSSLFQRDTLFLLVPCAVLFAIPCSQTGFGHSLRYVLPAFPFAMLFASSLFRDGEKNRCVLALGSIALAGHVFCSLSVYPHSLSYFNSLAGGPINGHAHLLDGNLDWGQDLLYLEKWVKAHPEAHPLHVGYWGFLPLDALEMNFSEFDFELDESMGREGLPKVPPGWYAISVNNLRGDFRMENRKYRQFLKRTPRDMVGYSIYIYHVPHDGE